MKTKFLCLLGGLFLVTSINKINAQVSIGTDEKPVAGSIMQLKNITGITTGKANSSKGLGMPRVNLEAEKSLMPCADGTEDDNAEKHIGLVVYNLKADSYFCPGLYVWTGDAWRPVSQTLANNSTAGATVVGDDISNSFVVKGSYDVEIPITKAFKVWETDLGKGANYLSRNFDDISVEFLWQDDKNLFRHAELIKDPSEPTNSKIRLVAGCPTSTIKTGNAVVAIRIKAVGFVENDIRWNWHVWVTDYDPNNGSTNSFNSFTWMDRNLGATTISPESVGSFGMYYQWGRKDPFPGPKTWLPTNNSAYAVKDIYKQTNEITSIAITEVAKADNVEEAIKTPTTFYKALKDQSPGSWHTNVQFPFQGADLTANEYKATLWGASGRIGNNLRGPKSIYDPCPENWRMPVTGTWNDVWKGLPQDAAQWIDPAGTGAYGCKWTDAGYFPFAGTWYPSNGIIMRVNSAISLWTGSLNGPYFASQLVISKKENASGELLNEFDQFFLGGSTSQHHAHGYPVRCVKE